MRGSVMPNFNPLSQMLWSNREKTVWGGTMQPISQWGCKWKKVANNWYVFVSSIQIDWHGIHPICIGQAITFSWGQIYKITFWVRLIPMLFKASWRERHHDGLIIAIVYVILRYTRRTHLSLNPAAAAPPRHPPVAGGNKVASPLLLQRYRRNTKR